MKRRKPSRRDCDIDLDTSPASIAEELLAREGESPVEAHRRALRSVVLFLHGGGDPKETFKRTPDRLGCGVVLRSIALVAALGAVDVRQINEKRLGLKGIRLSEIRAATREARSLPAIARLVHGSGRPN